MKFRVFWDVAPCCHVELIDASEFRTASFIRAMNFKVTTRRYIPGGSNLEAVCWYLQHNKYDELSSRHNYI
jgi:hypothetical protein